jgi:hypothetical protein
MAPGGGGGGAWGEGADATRRDRKQRLDLSELHARGTSASLQPCRACSFWARPGSSERLGKGQQRRFRGRLVTNLFVRRNKSYLGRLGPP